MNATHYTVVLEKGLHPLLPPKVAVDGTAHPTQWFRRSILNLCGKHLLTQPRHQPYRKCLGFYENFLMKGVQT